MIDYLLEGNSLKKEKSGTDTFSYDDLVDEFTGFYLAGMDTTGHLVNMTLYYIAAN